MLAIILGLFFPHCTEGNDAFCVWTDDNNVATVLVINHYAYVIGD